MASFDRKVERNRVRMNKKGKGPSRIGGGGQDPRYSLGPKGEGEVFRGRNILLPGVLVLLALLYAVVGLIGNASEVNSMLFWVTIVLYLILALTIFLRKPYLRIHKGWLYTSKFNRDRALEANNISKIKVGRGKITIIPKSKDVNWVFYRMRNRFDTEAMGERLEQYAKLHHVSFEKG
ncbi:hypothetical protein LBW89_03125 [Paenibacillus sp. alder61]|uniref:hypothetical protein n=1 Tax=Paenibacillus sp. alder61 TaxID=2862948 RepID=UPI001CD6B272|nr:hypothetical protein [Paenibacillus sp. alder61]MCA1292007.1 hypothetical protein [Paenibacillus sp. alder61]